MWTCEVCGNENYEEDEFCIECYQDREDVDTKRYLPKVPIRKQEDIEEEEEYEA